MYKYDAAAAHHAIRMRGEKKKEKEKKGNQRKAHCIARHLFETACLGEFLDQPARQRLPTFMVEYLRYLSVVLSCTYCTYVYMHACSLACINWNKLQRLSWSVRSMSLSSSAFRINGARTT